MFKSFVMLLSCEHNHTKWHGPKLMNLIKEEQTLLHLIK